MCLPACDIFSSYDVMRCTVSAGARARAQGDELRPLFCISGSEHGCPTHKREFVNGKVEDRRRSMIDPDKGIKKTSAEF